MSHTKPLGENKKKYSRCKNISEIYADDYSQYLLTEGRHIVIAETLSRKYQLPTCCGLTTLQEVIEFNLLLAIYL